MVSEFLELLRKDKKVMKELSERVAAEIALQPEFRKVFVKTVAGELATKEDIEKVRSEIKESEEKLRAEIKESEHRVKEELKSYIDARISDVSRTLQVGFTVLGIMIAGFALLVGLK